MSSEKLRKELAQARFSHIMCSMVVDVNEDRLAVMLLVRCMIGMLPSVVIEPSSNPMVEGWLRASPAPLKPFARLMNKTH